MLASCRDVQSGSDSTNLQGQQATLIRDLVIKNTCCHSDKTVILRGCYLNILPFSLTTVKQFLEKNSLIFSTIRKKKQLKTVKDSFSSVQSTKSSGSIRHSLGRIKTIFHLTD